jgi:phosphoadenosine phosphosulfate reductase
MMAWSESETRVGEAIAPRLERMNAELREASADTILRVSMQREWPGQIAYVSSFGAESVVMLALIADVDPGLPVIFIDTGMHFPQTLDHRDEVIAHLGLTDVRTLQPDAVQVQKLDPKGTLWKTDTDACCDVRKVRPLEPGITPFGAWITGRKRFHGGARVQLPVFEYAAGRFKVNPMANWSPPDIAAFLARRKLPEHALLADGYPSIGCWPCTKPTEAGADPRAGRWAGQKKTECGLHVDKADRPRVF